MEKVNVGKLSIMGGEFVVLPLKEYERLKAGLSEDAQLIALGDAHRGEETFPADVARRLIAGEPPLKVIREWRGLTQAALHKASKVSQVYISQIERRLNDRTLGKKAAQKLAPALRVSADALMD